MLNHSQIEHIVAKCEELGERKAGDLYSGDDLVSSFAKAFIAAGMPERALEFEGEDECLICGREAVVQDEEDSIQRYCQRCYKKMEKALNKLHK